MFRSITREERARALVGVIQFLSGCKASGGGFGGGPGQLPHLAPTYAAVASIVSIGGEHALRAIDRRAVLAFISSMCIPPEQGGGLSLCHGRTKEQSIDASPSCYQKCRLQLVQRRCQVSHVNASAVLAEGWRLHTA